MSLIVLTHINYDWNRVEPMIQQQIHTLKAKGINHQEAERQAVQEILQKYPLQNRGFEAIISIINNFLEIKQDN